VGRLEVTAGPMQSAAERDGLVSAPAAPPLRSHPYRQPLTWFLSRRGYVLYMLRELTALPVAIWWLLFLLEVSRLRDGAGGYRPLEGWFVAVSVVCLAAALWHSYTFLNLAGLIMRIPLGDRNVAPRTIVSAAFGGFVVLTAVVAGLLIWGGV
jgi:fumarate reductase subunit C